MTDMEKDYYEPQVDPITDLEGRGVGDYHPGSIATTEEKPSVTEQASEIAAKAQEKAGEVGGMAKERADQGIDRAADGLQKAADTMRSRMEDQGGIQGEVGAKVAGGLEATASYLKDHDSAELWGEVESFVKEHPLQAAAGALVAGWMLGRMMR